MAQVLGSDLASFRADFAGVVITPDDPDYDTARSVWNGAIDRRPAVIARCSDAEQVAAAVAYGRAAGLEISIRGGGHNFAGFAVCDGGLMVDLSAMRQVSVDAEARRARCGGGATWAEIDAAGQQHGLAVTGGFISSTGVAGLTLGGGIGWLTRAHGLSCDNLVGAQVVTAGGRIVRASADENPELLWALRGGGGNFGVVTEFEFALHPVGPMVNIGFFFWGIDKGREVLRFAREYTRGLPENNGVLVAGLNAPPAPFVPEAHQMAPGYAIIVVGLGSPEEHAAAVAPIREQAPLVDFVSPIPYTMLQAMMDEGNPWGISAYEKALHLDEMSDGAIDVIAEHLPGKQSPLSFMPVFLVDGAYARVAEGESAFSGRRTARWVVNIAAVCPAPDMLPAERQWVRTFWDALRPHAKTAGSYVNFMSEYDEDRVRASYGAEKYERLARIKAEWDPENVFHLNANVKPALQPA
ncbi:MAG TPA: FAD-binding oxidoreductase [Candidatus Dormibacteraeota bacterium]|jgi:FAD/FMN-containing dehydrogenase|nr:FAD-binding oxidoreductase [Candidatus Dormibacteraeota bacterium]